MAEYQGKLCEVMMLTTYLLLACPDTGPPAIKLDHRRSQMYQNSKPHGRWPRL